MNDAVGSSIVIVFSLLVGRFIAAEASYQWAKRTRSGLRYPVGVGLRVLLRAGGPMMIFAGYKVSEHAVTAFSWLLVVFCVFLGVGSVLGEPGEISTTSEGIAQKTCLGYRTKKIPWKGLAAQHDSVLREVLVIGHDGTSITHSQHHVGVEQLLRELRKHGAFVHT